MGTEYYLIDDTGRNVLDLHKSYWLAYEDHRHNLDAMTIADVEHAAEDCPDGWRHWLPPLVVRWMREIAQGRPCKLRSEYWYDGVCEPWLAPHDKIPGTPAYPYRIADGWTLYTPWHADAPEPHETPWPPTP
jgi:hypothetical protein